MKYIVPVQNWTTALIELIRTAENDDTIIVRSQAMCEMGKRACERMRPDKKIVFEIKEQYDEWWLSHLREN